MPFLREQLPAQPEGIHKIVLKASTKATDTVLIQEIDIEVHVMTHHKRRTNKGHKCRKHGFDVASACYHIVCDAGQVRDKTADPTRRSHERNERIYNVEFPDLDCADFNDAVFNRI